MATSKTYRIYLVSRTDTHAEHLVRASSPILAERHVIAPSLVTSRVATQDDMVRMLKKDVEIENARNDAAEE